MKQSDLDQQLPQKVRKSQKNLNKSLKNKINIDDYESKATMKNHNIVNLRIRSNKY